MTKRDVLVVCAAGAAVAFGGVMVAKSLFGGKMSDDGMRTIFEEMTTEELVMRRTTLATLLEATPPTDPKTEFRLKNEEGLAELDELLRSRGVDPETAAAPVSKKTGRR